MKFIFTNYSKKQFIKLDMQRRTRINDKLILLTQDELLLKTNIAPVVNLLPATHRLRIGSYRLLLALDGDNYIVLKVGHRNEIYKS